MAAPRVEPLAPDELSTEQKTFLKPLTGRDGTYPNVFGTLARHMDLVTAWSTFGLYAMRENQLDPIHREVLILRTAILINSDYEWHQHRKIALRVGMSDATLEQVRTGVATGDVKTQLLIDCTNELIAQQRIADDTWQALLAEFDLTYILDAIFTVGAYTTMGMALNSCGVEIEAHD